MLCVSQGTTDMREKRELDNFIVPNNLHTQLLQLLQSLLTTGVDAQTTGLIVLDSNIGF